jgi:hypothetical protein
MSRLLNLFLGILGLLVFEGCESVMPALPGIHYRADGISFTMSEAKNTASSLAEEVSAATGLARDPIAVVDTKYTASVYAVLRDDKGFTISISVYPRDRSLFLEIRGPSIRLGRAARLERREQELADIVRRIVEAHASHPQLILWAPKQGILGP